MENHQVLCQTFRRISSMEMNTDTSSHQQPEQHDVTQLDSFEGTLEPKIAPPTLALIETRIQQLHDRRFLLLNMQHLREKSKGSRDGSTEELTSDDSDKLGELEVIQRELEVLQAQMEEWQKQDKSSISSQQATSPSIYAVKPVGGVYMLPPLRGTQEDITAEQKIKTTRVTERPTGPVVPVDSLGQMAAVTQCPSCQEVVFTETQKKVGQAAWMLSCLCVTMGCIAGCCFIPFFMNRLKTVHHRCPQCRAHIHTHQPL